MNYLFITDSPEMASFVHQSGVERIFVDLEILGKQERQGAFDTVISAHQIENVAPVRAAVPTAELLVRVNPLHEGSLREIEMSLEAGADYLMLPMFRTAEEVSSFCRLVRGRSGVVPLVETAAAARAMRNIVAVDGVVEVHIGLNDLHRDLGLSFMFEPLANGLVDRLAEACRDRNLPFGVGGISRVGHGDIPGELVLAEHCRIGSTRAILSRAFHMRAQTAAELEKLLDFPGELARLRDAERRLLGRTQPEIERDCETFRTKAMGVANRLRKAG